MVTTEEGEEEEGKGRRKSRAGDRRIAGIEMSFKEEQVEEEESSSDGAMPFDGR